MSKKKAPNLSWAYKKLRWYVKSNCLDFDHSRCGDMRYVLEKYYQLLGIPKPNVRVGVLAIKEYNRESSPIFRGNRVAGLTLKTKKVKKLDYNEYIKSGKWRRFKKNIIEQRGASCELCKNKANRLDLHHKTYDRLFNEGPEDVMLLCHPCHEKVHDRKF